MRHGDGVKPPPRVRNVLVIDFDMQAALLLAQKFPMHELERIKKTEGLSASLTHLKFDVMIVACALRHKSKLHITLDGDHPPLCKTAGLECVSPMAWVRDPQANLPGT